MTVFEKIEEQQRGKEDTAAWMVGEQLKDICANDPASAEIINLDMDIAEMGIEAAAGKIKEWADERKGGKNSL